MSTGSSVIRDSDEDSPTDEDLIEFRTVLNEFKSTGCALLVVGEASRRFFTRASSQLLGDDEEVRYRVIATTDSSVESIAERLPDPDETPRPLGETTHVLNHAGKPRSVTSASNPATPPKLLEIQETCIVDPRLEGLKSALTDAIDDFARRPASIRPSDLRIGIDSLTPLLDQYDWDVVRRCLRTVGELVHEYDAMAHYVLPRAYDSEAVQSLVDDVDAVVELRNVELETFGHESQQRWHVPDRNLTMDWTPL